MSSDPSRSATAELAPEASAPAAATAVATAAAVTAPSGGAERLREDLVHPDSLLDALLEACRLQGVAVTRAALSAGLPLERGRLRLGLVERAVERVGMSARLRRLPLDSLDPYTLPALLALQDNGACLLLGWADDGAARVLLPETGQGEMRLPRDELAARYAGIAVFVRPRLRFDARASVAPAGAEATPAAAEASGHWFWRAIAAQRGVYADVLWAALLINLFALALPLFTMNVYDRVVPNHAMETLWALAIGVALVMCMDLFMRSLRSRFVDEASARIDVQLSATLMERVLGMRLAHRPESVGSFAANLRGFEQVRDFIASGTVLALVDLPFAVLFLGVMLWISPWLALPPLVAAVAILVAGYVLQYRLHELAKASHEAGALRNATLVESLTGIETIKSQAAEGLVQGRWEQANTQLARLTVRMRGLAAKASYGTAWLTQLATVAIVVVGVYLIGERALSMGGLIACSMLAGRALAPAGQVVGLLMQYQGARTALDSLNAVMAKPVERPAGERFVHRGQLRGDIEFRNVRFAYPNRQDAALDGVSFRIAAGERVALIGRVGSGKSTVHKLMLGLFQPSEGAVLLDGIDLRQLDPADVRRNLACVSQDVTLFYGSLRENIAFGLPHADDGAIVAAAETAGLAEFVNRHPRGFDMPVGERGEFLSGGQRQAVGLARALLHHAPVLLLDEPTSAMDFSTEAQVTQRVAAFSRDKTVVLVTHRTSMLAMVDRVIVIDGGRVVADGPRDRIMEALQSGRIARAAP